MASTTLLIVFSALLLGLLPTISGKQPNISYENVKKVKQSINTFQRNWYLFIKSKILEAQKAHRSTTTKGPVTTTAPTTTEGFILVNVTLPTIIKDKSHYICPTRPTASESECNIFADYHNECLVDDDCLGIIPGTKCCVDGCRRICVDPVPAPKPTSECAPVAPLPPKNYTIGVCPIFKDKCNHDKPGLHICDDDGDCTRIQPGTKCCLKGCNRMCAVPLNASEMNERVCQRISVGVEDRSIIPDSSFSASSELNCSHEAKEGRANAKVGWIPADNNNPNDYLQIDMGKIFVICAVATQGNELSVEDEGTSEYKISTSFDNKIWTTYPSNSSPKLFRGAIYFALIKNVLTVPFEARYVRFIPTKFSIRKILRVKMYGLPMEVLPDTCPVSSTAEECPPNVDHQCGISTNCNTIQDGTKCCLKDCQRVCMVPYKNLIPIKEDVVPGKCPVLGFAAECPPIEDGDNDPNECQDDFDCSTFIKPGTKCCLDGCSRRCVKPEPIRKPIPTTKVCQGVPVGIADKNIIPDSSFTASSEMNEEYQAKDGRLLSSIAGWEPESNKNPDDYLQIDMGKVIEICALETQGHGSAETVKEFTTQYKISTSLDNELWTTYPNDFSPKLFPGNIDQETVWRNLLDIPVQARFIRFIPTKWHGWKVLRVEVYGLPVEGAAGNSVPTKKATLASPTSTKKEYTTTRSSYAPVKRNWKQCAWRKTHNKGDGLIKECMFKKNDQKTALRVSYVGFLRISGCKNCCKRWYFTFNGIECNGAFPIDGILYTGANTESHRYCRIHGYCTNIPNSNVRVGFWVGDCLGETPAKADAQTGLLSTSRIVIEEVSAPQPQHWD